MRKLLRRPSPAMVVACLALLVALGGTSVAAVNQLGRNTVGTPQLVNGAVTNSKIRNNAVNSSKVANRSCSGPTSLLASFLQGRLVRRVPQARRDRLAPRAPRVRQV